MFQPTKEPPGFGLSAAVWNIITFQMPNERPFWDLVRSLSR